MAEQLEGSNYEAAAGQPSRVSKMMSSASSMRSVRSSISGFTFARKSMHAGLGLATSVADRVRDDVVDDSRAVAQAVNEIAGELGMGDLVGGTTSWIVGDDVVNNDDNDPKPTVFSGDPLVDIPASKHHHKAGNRNDGAAEAADLLEATLAEYGLLYGLDYKQVAEEEQAPRKKEKLDDRTMLEVLGLSIPLSEPSANFEKKPKTLLEENAEQFWTILTEIAFSKTLRVVVFGLIVLMQFSLGIQLDTDWRMVETLKNLNHVFLSVFIAELVIRVAVSLKENGKLNKFLSFDVSLVVITTVSLWVAQSDVCLVLLSLRSLRILKRLSRMEFSFARPLRMLLGAFGSALQTFMWGAVALVVNAYAFALVIQLFLNNVETNLTTNYEVHAVKQELFPSMIHCMITLLSSTFEGIDWEARFGRLLLDTEASQHVGLVLYAYMYFSKLCLCTLILSMFIDEVLNFGVADDGLSYSKVFRGRVNFRLLRTALEAMDENVNGMLSLGEFWSFFDANPKVLHQLGLRTENLVDYWRYFDPLDEKEVPFEDVMYSYLKLMAGQSDINSLIKDYMMKMCTKAIDPIDDGILHLETKILHLDTLLDDQADLLQNTALYLAKKMPEAEQRLKALEARMDILMQASKLSGLKSRVRLMSPSEQDGHKDSLRRELFFLRQAAESWVEELLANYHANHAEKAVEEHLRLQQLGTPSPRKPSSTGQTTTVESKKKSAASALPPPVPPLKLPANNLSDLG
eukprot:gnl/TRDRNA2_/TRDRNA2_174850_c0_seq1.p1 gnl/TRDRNA2_/TRDRNA2_174850_c0~~gnl/TRDRNA2_/TRDRNA2_174850_c0_seq1.p1  ORF type:complete len:744 (+),score=126.67 gnl/TRDRNA2_/TRDRNA2_174850_c0_seq1:24-2255(+)